MSRFVSGRIMSVEQRVESSPVNKRGMTTTHINTVITLDNGKNYNIEGGELNLTSGEKIGFYLKPKSNVVESIIRNRSTEKELLKINSNSIITNVAGVLIAISLISVMIYGIMGFISTGNIYNILVPLFSIFMLSPAVYYTSKEGFEDRVSKKDRENINNYLKDLENGEDKADVLVEEIKNNIKQPILN